MKKISTRKILNTFLFLFAMLFAVSVQTSKTVHAMSKTAQHKLYKKTMQNYAKKATASYKRNSLYTRALEVL